MKILYMVDPTIESVTISLSEPYTQSMCDEAKKKIEEMDNNNNYELPEMKVSVCILGSGVSGIDVNGTLNKNIYVHLLDEDGGGYASSLRTSSSHPISSKHLALIVENDPYLYAQVAKDYNNANGTYSYAYYPFAKAVLRE